MKLDPWSDRLELIKSKPIGVVAEREKMPFEVTPFMPYLTRYGSEKPTAAANTSVAPEPAPNDASTPKPSTPNPNR